MRSWLSRLPGFTIWRCIVDAMHCLDLGVYQVLVACALCEMSSEHIWPGDNQDERLLAGYAQYKIWCKGQDVEPCHRFDLKK